ncbi:MAG: CDP-diacylglycerol--serine O-phosphatidyltransferase [Candidatus Symbiodolus clandestinus]
MKPLLPVKKHGIYLLPNLLTTASLFSGFYAVIAAMNQQFEAAAIAIFIAMVWDGLDGRVARLMNAQNSFGAQYDSLSDMVSFGIAPALVAYQWSLSGVGKLGWLAAFVYVAGAALRLARFNLQAEGSDKHYFQGLPSPPAAATLAGMVWVGQNWSIDRGYYACAATLVIPLLGLFMVSNFRYRSFKDIAWRHRISFVMVLGVVSLFVVISLNPPLILFLSFAAYALSGPVITYRTIRKVTIKHVVGDTDEAYFDENGDEKLSNDQQQDKQH